MNGLTRWRLAGILSIIVLGFLFHFLYSWTGASKIIGLFAPVNESVWEHLKLGYWSVVLFSIVEYLQLRSNVNNYYFARLIGILALEISVLIIFYTYNFVAGKDILLMDIFSYIAGTIICQYITYLFLRARSFSVLINRISLAVLIAMGVVFGMATYYPPHIPLFKDNNSNTYGINQEK